MREDQITDAKELIAEVSAFGDKLKERRRHERKRLLWAATVEVRGQRFEGMIVDLSPGGARIKFDAAVAEGDELTLMLKQLDELGAKVVWRRQGEAGIQFLLAPEEVAARVQSKLAFDIPAGDVPGDQDEAPEAAATSPEPQRVPAPKLVAPARPVAAAAPASKPRGARLATIGAISATALAGLVGGSMVMAKNHPAEGLLGLPVTVGAADQHSCDTLMSKVGGATNSIDFSLNVGSALNSKCLDLQHLGPTDSALNERMVHAAKRGLH